MTKTQQQMTTAAKRTEAKKGFKQCFDLLQSYMPLEDWRLCVKPEIAAYAIKCYGSLDEMYFESRSDVCKLAFYCYDIWQGVENPVYGQPGVH